MAGGLQTYFLHMSMLQKAKRRISFLFILFWFSDLQRLVKEEKVPRSHQVSTGDPTFLGSFGLLDTRAFPCYTFLCNPLTQAVDGYRIWCPERLDDSTFAKNISRNIFFFWRGGKGFFPVGDPFFWPPAPSESWYGTPSINGRGKRTNIPPPLTRPRPPQRMQWSISSTNSFLDRSRSQPHKNVNQVFRKRNFCFWLQGKFLYDQNSEEEIFLAWKLKCQKYSNTYPCSSAS